MPVLVHESLKNSRFLDALFSKIHVGRNDSQNEVKYSQNLNNAHLLFDCYPPPLKLAINVSFVRDENSIATTLEVLEKIQRSFRHCCTVIMCRNQDLWLDINTKLCGGMMRLVWARSFEESVELVAQLHQDMCQREAIQKLKKQNHFFDNEQNKLNSDKSAIQIYNTALASLGIESQVDIDILKDGFPSLRILMTTEFDTLNNCSPVNIDSLQHVASFFHAPFAKHISDNTHIVNGTTPEIVTPERNI